MPRLSVLMPVYNEVHTLRTIVKRVLEAPIDLQIELIMVDDGSTDGSRGLMDALAAEDPRVVSIHQPRNFGKGAAIARAIQHATGEFSIIQDADLEYDPADYPLMLRPLLAGHADVVYGSRFTSPERRVHLFWHQIANEMLSTMSNMFNDLNLTDMETGYKAFRTELLKIIPIKSERFGIEPEITAKIARLGARVYEVPIRYHGRSQWEGKKITWKDGVSALGAMIKYRFLDPEFTTHTGFRALRVMAQAERFNRLVLETVKPHLGRRVMHAGSGIGTLSRYLIKVERLVLVEDDPLYVGLIQRHFANMRNVSILPLDMKDPATFDKLSEERLDTILGIHVIEQFDDDSALLKSFHRVLVPGGRVVLLAHQGQRIFGEMDRSVGYRRRYSRSELKEKLEAAGFEVEELFDFNKWSTPAWWLNGRFLGRREVPDFQVKAMDALVPLLEVGSKVLPWPGLSLVAVARKRIA